MSDGAASRWWHSWQRVVRGARGAGFLAAAISSVAMGGCLLWSFEQGVRNLAGIRKFVDRNASEISLAGRVTQRSFPALANRSTLGDALDGVSRVKSYGWRVRWTGRNLFDGSKVGGASAIGRVEVVGKRGTAILRVELERGPEDRDWHWSSVSVVSFTSS